MSTARLEAVATDTKQEIPMQPASLDSATPIDLVFNVVDESVWADANGQGGNSFWADENDVGGVFAV